MNVASLLRDAAAAEADGRFEAARELYVRALGLDVTHYDTLMRLGALLARTGQLAGARTVFEQAVRTHPLRALPRAYLANVLVDADDVDAARAMYEEAIGCDDGCVEAHRGLAILLERAGDPDAARSSWRRGFPDGNVVMTGDARRPDAPLLMLLTSAVGGNIPAHHWIDDRTFSIATVIAESYQSLTRLPVVDLVVNLIGDADRNRWPLRNAREIAAAVAAPVINDPACVMRTTRVEVAERLAPIDGVRVARVAQTTRAAVREAGFAYPFLVRAPGYHTGLHFTRVADDAALSEALAALPRDAVLAIEYLDTRDAGGMYAKYRVMTIDGKLYPIHLAISADWNVHYYTAAMANNAAYREREAGFLADFRTVLGPKAIAALEAVAATLALDYGGIDFALDHDGGIVVFEANATMILVPPDADTRWDYRRAPVERAITAARTMLVERARAGDRNGADGGEDTRS